MNERLNRRQFLSMNWDATVGFVGNLVLSQLDDEREFFRPPGASTEVEFLTLCTRCGLCKNACPEETISLFSLASGAKLANTPFIDPNIRPCTMCGKCIDVCPSHALTTIANGGSAVVGFADILPDNCLAFKDVMCDYCIRACPQTQAIYLDNGKPVVIAENCNGCGLCVSRCISVDKGIWIKL
ncbi:ferredoxin-type protein NapG [Mesobacillus persicus]|uniref:Ferredoxin-type protein NapG n=1 Tax=Mesobacillus persicus TaxID=930146 RepID=A0A1H8EYT5_9BACI|nr:4Fe-4S dicluster domain-containing protein [Mesobacillus persicus]SEN24550.1 ferredoxin-type protein NapG [Mesobacillus persicus]